MGAGACLEQTQTHSPTDGRAAASCAGEHPCQVGIPAIAAACVEGEQELGELMEQLRLCWKLEGSV